MNSLQKVRSRFGTMAEFLELLWDNKMWWLIPPVVLLLLVGILLVFAQGSAVAPFIYTLF